MVVIWLLCMFTTSNLAATQQVPESSWAYCSGNKLWVPESSGACCSANKLWAPSFGELRRAPESSWACCSGSKLWAPESSGACCSASKLRASSSERAPELVTRPASSGACCSASKFRAPELRESSRAPSSRELRSLLLDQQAPSFSGAPEVARRLLLLQRSKLWSSGEAPKAPCCNVTSSEASPELPELQRSSGACLPLQTKETKKKISILPDRGRVGLVGARASVPTPQHHSNSTASAPLHSISSAPQHQLRSTASAPQHQLHKNSSTIELWWWSEGGMVALLKLFWSFLGANNGVIIVLDFPGISYPAYVY